MIKGKIKFTENGFILYPNDGVRYKWTNAPKKIEEDDE